VAYTPFRDLKIVLHRITRIASLFRWRIPPLVYIEL